MKIKMHCATGSSPDCHLTVEADLPYDGLSTADITTLWATESGRTVVASIRICPPNADWVLNNEYLLSSSNIEQIKSQGFFEVHYSDLECKVCCACYPYN